MDPVDVLDIKAQNIEGYSVSTKIDRKKLELFEFISEDVKRRFSLSPSKISEDSTKVLCVHSREIRPTELEQMFSKLDYISLNLFSRKVVGKYEELVYRTNVFLKENNLSIDIKGTGKISDGDFGHNKAMPYAQLIVEKLGIFPNADSKVTIQREVYVPDKPTPAKDALSSAFNKLYNSTTGGMRDRMEENNRRKRLLLEKKVRNIGEEFNLPKAERGMINSCVILMDDKKLEETENNQT